MAQHPEIRTNTPTTARTARTLHSRLFSTLATATAAALLTLTSGVGVASAAPGDTSNSSGQFLSGSLFALPLSAAIDLSAETATNDGTQPPVESRDNIDLTALSAVSVQLPNGAQVPLDIAQVGTLSQYARANPDGSSLGASGAVSDDGAIGVGSVPSGQAPGDLTVSLGEVVTGLALSPALLAEVANLNLTVGAVSAQASQTAPDSAVGDYEIADLDLSFQSSTVAAILNTIDTAVASLQTQLGGLEVNLDAAIAAIPDEDPDADIDVTVAVPSLTTAISDVLTQELSSGGVTIDLATGIVSVDLALLNDLNNLDPNTNLLATAQVDAITDNITSLIDGLVADVGTALQDTVDGIAVTGTVASGEVDTIIIDTTIGALLAGSIVGLIVLAPLSLGGPAGLLAVLFDPITDIDGIDDIEGLLSGLVLDPVDDLVVPAVAPVLNAAVALTGNVQGTTGGVFTETALRVTVLPQADAFVANLASASVGPNAALPDPVITGIVPDSGPDVGGTEVTLTGTNFDGTTSVTVDGVVVTPTSVTPTSIVFITPTHSAAVVDVVVNAPQGDSAAVDFEYLAVASTAVSLTPDEGSEAGGTVVTITGSGFLGSTDVTFDGISGVDVAVLDDTTITVTSPAHAAGQVDVVVVDPAGNSAPLDFTYLAVASVATTIDPAQGPVVGGTVVTISGTGFTGATGVEFDDIPGTAFSVVNDTTITVTTPANDLGAADVVVLDPAGDSDPLDFEYTAQPAIATSLTPVEGTEAGGTLVTVTGSGFLGATAVEFDGTPGTVFTVVDDTTITVTSPAHAPGAVDVVVVDAAGNSAPLDYEFLSIESIVDGIDPVEGPESGGTVVTLTGTGFTGATGVEFDGIPGTAFAVVSDTTITVSSPLHTPGIVDVVVVDELGGDSDPVDFEYLAVAADATSLVPNVGPEAGGTVVTITGTGFLGATGAEFDDIPGTAFAVVNDTTITVTSPAHTPGLIGVVVLDPAGDSDPVAFEYQAVASVATSLDPTFGPTAGGTVVTVTGSGFTGATGVEFDGTPGTTFTVVDDSTITVTSPAHTAGIVDVVVIDPVGNSGALDFEYGALPSDATSLTPNTGSELGGTTVTLTGSGFTGATGVAFDGVAGTGFTVVDDTTITVVSPAHAPGTVDVVVADAAGSSEALDFTYFAIANIDAVTPSTGPEAGGTPVTITGTCFTGATAVFFGDLEVTDFEISADGTTITVISPAGSGLVDVVVVGSEECGSATLGGGFTYEAAPAVATSLSPVRGPSTGGTEVTIIGTGFTGSTGVTFGGAAASSFRVVNDTTIIAISPASAPSTVDVVVLDPAGNSAALDFEFHPVAQIAAITPDSGAVTGGTTVRITGQCFAAASEVRFGSALARSFSVNATGTVITAVSPASRVGTGAVDITVVGAGECGTDSVADGFTYVAPVLPATGVSITAGLWAALVLLVGGAAVIFIRRRLKSNNMASK